MKTMRQLCSFLNIKKSFLSKLFFLLISLMLVSIIIIISIWTFNTYGVIGNLSQSYISDIARNANSKFESDLFTLRSDLEAITGNSDVKAYASAGNDTESEALNAYLYNCYSLINSDVVGIAVITPSKSKTIGSFFSENSADSTWYREILNANGKTILINRSIMQYGTIQQKISIGCAIMSYGSPCGVVVFDIRDSMIIKYFGINHMNGVLRSMLIDPDGNIIFTGEQNLRYEDMFDTIQYIKNSSVYDTIITADIDGSEYFVMAKKFSSSPDWINITVCQSEKIYSEYNRLIRMLMLFMLLVILITMLLAFLSFSSIRKGFNRLSDYIGSIDLNNIDKISNSALPSGDDEIGMISQKVNRMVKTISDQMYTINALEEKKRIDEIQILKAQVNPHLIYNTLNIIQTTAEYQKNTTISSIAKSLALLLRYSVTDTDQLVTLQNEFDYIKSYITIIQHRFINDINLTIMADDSVKQCRTLKMILQPIVENSIKHGFTDAPGQHIVIKAYRDGDSIFIKITDNGLGIPKEKLPQLSDASVEGGSHLGLNNVNRRLKLTFGNRYGLTISSIPNTQTTVGIEIPFMPEH